MVIPLQTLLEEQSAARQLRRRVPQAADLRRALGPLARPARAVRPHRGAHRRRLAHAADLARLALQWPVRLVSCYTASHSFSYRYILLSPALKFTLTLLITSL